MALAWADVDLETKLEPVLEAWPHLEQVLAGLSPNLDALANPLLRRTFARAATLRQVALALGVGADDLMRTLQLAVSDPRAPAPPAARAVAPDAPAWTSRTPFARHDARLDVERGIHPLPVVLAELERVPDGETYELLTPLVPAPLIGVLAKKGFEVYSALDEQRGMARTVIRRA